MTATRELGGFLADPALRISDDHIDRAVFIVNKKETRLRVRGRLFPGPNAFW